MEEEQIIEQPVSEEHVVDASEDNVESQPKMVPLTALEAERRKRQDLEAQNRLYADYMERMKNESSQEQEPEEDLDKLLDIREFREAQQVTKREIREEVYKDMNPKAMEKVKQYLDKILEKKPWLADSIKSSENRYARAAEIVEDYQHLVETKPNYKTGNEGARIVANANKPGSPVTTGKSSPTSNAAYLKSIQGTPAFREYRQKAMRGEL